MILLPPKIFYLLRSFFAPIISFNVAWFLSTSSSFLRSPGSSFLEIDILHPSPCSFLHSCTSHPRSFDTCLHVYPGSRIFYPSRIQKQQQKRGVKKNCCRTFFVAKKFHKTEHYFIFEMLEKKFGANFQRIIEIFRVVDPDPDPYWIRIQLEAWIRIRIR